MALQAGTVTIDGNGNASGGGLSRAIYDQLVSTNIDPYSSGLDASTIVAAKQGLASYTNSLAAGVVPYFKDNGDVRIKSSDSGLQRTPNPNNPDTDTQGPSADVVLAGALE